MSGACTATACPYCGVGCGVLATPGPDGVAIAGDPSHPANLGRLCSKGAALGETLDLEGRLLQPRIGERETDWDEAVGLVARKFRQAIDEHGPESVAIYASGQLLTEDYYVANKLMKGFIGAANIDTNSRLCMASTVAGHKRAFGSDTVPGCYEDLEQADLIVLVGSNLAWCHPVLFQRIAAAKAMRPGMRVVTVDPRRTASSDLADLELALAPGSDVALFNGLLNAIEAAGAIDAAFVAAHVAGLPETLGTARKATLERVSAETGVAPGMLTAFFDAWIGSEKVVTVYSQGVNQSASGTDKVNAIVNCHLATGRIGHPGMGPFSVTGQPNAMGGREVGGLANMLACHLEIEDPLHRAAVREFWRAPTICERPGLKAIDLFDACLDGRVKALWIMSTNPAVSLPEADRVCEALSTCDFVAVSDIMAETDTVALADVVLPATGWGEKSGTVTNSERVISRQRAFLPPPGSARPDWRIICDVAGVMGWEKEFAYTSPAEIFREHAALSGIAGRLGRDFDISGLAGLSDADYDTLSPVQWPVTEGRRGGRFFADGGFFTADRRARMLALDHRAPQSVPDDTYPLRLNTGRVRDHWHTMTRTAKTARLSRHMAEPFVEIHPFDADQHGVRPATLVRLTSPHGTAVMRALVTARTPRGSVFAPMHWTAQFASAGKVDALVPATVDPVSGQPELKAAVVSIAPLEVGWYGFAIARTELRPQTAYWSRARVEGGWQAEIADSRMPDDWEAFARALIGAPESATISVTDASHGTARVACLVDGRLAGALFASADPVEIARSHVIAGLGTSIDRAAFLAGRPGAGIADPGALVCSCFHVGANTILNAIGEGGLDTVEAVGARLAAGTNCGSCRPEIRALLARAEIRMAAE